MGYIVVIWVGTILPKNPPWIKVIAPPGKQTLGTLMAHPFSWTKFLKYDRFTRHRYRHATIPNGRLINYRLDRSQH